MESAASTVRFLVPMVLSRGCTPASGWARGEHRRGWGEPSSAPYPALGTPWALTVRHADPRAQPLLALLAP